MPQLGEIRKAKEIGKKGTNRYVWQACEICGKERWVVIKKGISEYKICFRCANKRRVASKEIRERIGSLQRGKVGPQHNKWKGGRWINGEGYVEIWVPPDDFFSTMTNRDHYTKEHRLVMAQHLGRCLQPWEVVHHKNGIKTDNRIENLELTTKGNHSKDHNKGYRDGYQKGLLDGRLKQIEELKQEIRLLRLENKRFQEQLTKKDLDVLV